VTKIAAGFASLINGIWLELTSLAKGVDWPFDSTGLEDSPCGFRLRGVEETTSACAG
jgi:hypothetical protein